jgi:predicted site-specific integrase-resolvase
VKYIKLSEWAKLNNYTYRGAFGLFKRGGIPDCKQFTNGTILVGKPDEKLSYNVIYARVSSSENKSNLESQALCISQFCNAKGWVINEIIKECGSGLNDNRPKLEKILKERKATRIVIEHKDRLTRFGFNYIRALFPECEIVIINEVASDKEDLIQDFISIVTSYCARIYGNRRSKRKTEILIKQLESQE